MYGQKADNLFARRSPGRGAGIRADGHAALRDGEGFPDLCRCSVNGENYKMLLDTGAPRTIIGYWGKTPPAHSTEVGLEITGKNTLATVELAGADPLNLVVLKANVANFTRTYDGKVNGILGQDVMRRFSRVMIDFRAHQIELTP